MASRSCPSSGRRPTNSADAAPDLVRTSAICRATWTPLSVSRIAARP
jgi:hypothetical protein